MNRWGSHPKHEKHYTGDLCEHFPIQGLPRDTMGQFYGPANR